MIPAIHVDFKFSHSFVNRKARQVPLHTHAFWQLEVIGEGPLTLLETGGQRDLLPGQAVLIPEEWRHGFAYPDRTVSWTTCKFRLSGMTHPRRILRLEADPLLEPLLSALRILADTPRPDLQTDRFNHLLAALLQPVAASLRPPPSTEEAFLEGIENRIRKARGGPLNIQTLAGDMGYDPGYLAARFKQLTGRSLKTHIDAGRMDRARELLRYSMMTVSEIAEELGFPEIYSFSRFFKKHAGRSPTAWRREQSPS